MLDENKIGLNKLNDFQKSLLARISYLDIDNEAFQKLKAENKEITISDLHSLLKAPDHFYVGAVADIGVIKRIAGMEMTDKQLLETIENAGLGKILIRDVRANDKSGFEGMCFEDEFGNVGFSFRGTDLKTFKSLLNDVSTDVISFLTAGKVTQVKDAKKMFEDNFDKENRKNYLYGHSLGGHLVESIFADYHSYIENAFIINPFNLDETVIANDPEKFEAFNNHEKFDCVIIGGDVVSKFNPPTFFLGNVRYVENAENRKNNFLYAHTVEAGKLDSQGMFKETTKKKAYANYDSELIEKFMGLADSVKRRGRAKIGLTQSVFKRFSSIKTRLKDSFVSLKKLIMNKRKKDSKELLDSSEKERELTEFNERLKIEKNVNNSGFKKADLENISDIKNPADKIETTISKSSIEDLDIEEEIK